MTARLVALSLFVVTLAAGGRAQELEDRPFELAEPFAAGEEWSTAAAVRTRLAVVDGASVVERSVGWTASAVVLEHARGFALRGTLTSLMTGRRAADVETVTVWREGQEGPWADPATRTWTVALDRRWKPLAVEGPARSFERLLDDALGRLPVEDGAGERLVERLRARLVEGAGPALDAWVAEALDELLAPVQAVLGHAADGGRLEPGDTLRLPGGPGAPPGNVTYLGHGDGVFVFGVTWDAPPGQPMEGGFALDAAGRLTSLVARSAHVRAAPGGRAVRITREVELALIAVHRSTPLERGAAAGEERRPH